MTYIPDLVLYHHPCSDGLTAAAVIKQYYDNIDETNIEYRRFDYGNKTPIEEYIELFRDKKVLMVDSSFKYQDMIVVQQSAESIIVIDHHKTAIEELADFHVGTYIAIDNFDKMIEEKVAMIYDGGHSGASLAYLIFNPDKELPDFLKYVEDVDCGRNKLPNSAYFRSWSRSIPFDIDEMIKIMNQYSTKEKLNDVFAAGAAIDKFVSTRISTIIEQVRFITLNAPKTLVIPYVISDYAFASEASNTLINAYDDGKYDVAITFFFTTTGLGGSIRAKNDFDSTIISKAFGGGGHKGASGFNISWDDLPDFLESLYELDEGNSILGDAISESLAY